MALHDNLWSVSVVVNKATSKWKSNIELPTFILDGNTHGIRDEADAMKVAYRIVNFITPDHGMIEIIDWDQSYEFSITAVRI